MAKKDQEGDRRTPISSGFGQFLAELDADTLIVTLPVAFTFLPGDPALVRGFSTDEYQWTRTEEEAFVAEFERRVQGRWSEKFAIQETRGKRRIGVEVIVEETELKEALWRIFVFRYPLDASDTAASVCAPGHSHFLGGCAGNPTGQDWGTVILASTHLRPEPVQNLEVGPIDILFPRDGTQPTAGWIDRAITWLPRGLDWHIRLVGFADVNEVNTDGTETFEKQLELATKLARARLRTITDTLTQHGVDPGRIQAVTRGDPGDDSFRQKVSMEVFRTESQDTLSHEAGHMLGLGDEAVTDSAVTGDPLPDPDYSARVFWYTRELVRRHDDEGIMSRGSTVRFWHYVPFLEAIEILTKSPAWKIVPRTGERADSQDTVYGQRIFAHRPRPKSVS